MAELKTLRRKRGNIKSAMTTFTKYLIDWNANAELVDLDFLEVALENLQRSFEKFDDLQDHLEELEPELEAPHREQYTKEFNTVVANARKLIRQCKKSQETGVISTESNIHRASSTVPTNLPPLPLPEFHGAVEEWTSFQELFTSIIDQVRGISSARKLQYLKASLKGPAKAVITSLGTTEANYEVAWALLNRKYNSTKKIVRRHWEILQQYPKLKEGSSSELSQFVDTVYQHLQALEALNLPVSSWDVPITELIRSKISNDLAWQWELQQEGEEIPPYTSLLQFLEKRANCGNLSTTSVETSSLTKNSRSSNPHSKKEQRHHNQRQTFVTTSTTMCPICSEQHRINSCQQFHNLSVEERQKKASNLSLCFNCLSPGHAIKNCSSSNCRVCHRRHHTLLHRQLPSNSVNAEFAKSNTTDHVQKTKEKA